MGNRNGSSGRRARGNVYTSPEEHQNAIDPSKVTNGSSYRRPGPSHSAGRQATTGASSSNAYEQHNQSLVNSQNQYAATHYQQQQQQQQQSVVHQPRTKTGSNSSNNPAKANSSKEITCILRQSYVYLVRSDKSIYVANYDFNGTAKTGELSFEKGDRLEIIDRFT